MDGRDCVDAALPATRPKRGCDSRYGLSGYVVGQDRALALKVGMGVRSGMVHVNMAITSTYVSLGGQRMSGIGRERGVEGLRQYQQLSCLNLGG